MNRTIKHRRCHLFVILLTAGFPHLLMIQAQEGILTDPRDGQLYRTVWIGEQHWMAENLNYGEGIKSCYDGDPGLCETYGGLYSWEVSTEVCPAGWHLPTREEWEQLSAHLGPEEAGQKMKAGREDVVPWDGNNLSGFSAIPAGAGNGEGFHRKGDWAIFWSATAYDDQRAWFAQLDGFWYPSPPKYKNLYVGWYYLKSNLFSVRCVENVSPTP
jgi:uncharacterized protein (TIGR02145 family)